MAAPTTPRKRFAPVPIETTFNSNRKNGPGPAGELTPSPSPRSTSPSLPSSPPPNPVSAPALVPSKEKRRFAPQLVESSVRRSRRAGDEGPATKHTDRTDITPYTKHIYAIKTKKKHGHGDELEHRIRHTRRESCDEEIAGGVFDLVARDAQRKLQEVFMSAFPNSGVRVGGAEHFYVRDGSDDDSLPDRGRSAQRGVKNQRGSRRDSSEEDVGWAFKEMQDHAHTAEKSRHGTLPRVSSADLDKMSIESPPIDVMKFTRRRQSSGSRRGSADPIALLRSESPLPTIGESTMPYIPSGPVPSSRPIGESVMPLISSGLSGKHSSSPLVPAAHIPPETGFRNRHSPFGAFRHQDRDVSVERLRNLHRLKNNSPPMLGKDLTFRVCPSPKHTKLEPDHLWDLAAGTTFQQPHRDVTGQKGLWNGYCYSADEKEAVAPVTRPLMIHTPLAGVHTTDPFSQAFASTTHHISEEPTPVLGGTSRAGSDPWNHAARITEPTSPHKRANGGTKGLHMLVGLEERLRKEKAAADLEEKIAAEFTDDFITQVYNYLSLGYPATARAYDDELSKISKFPIEDLEHDDETIMDQLTSAAPGQKRGGKKARGHILQEQQGVGEEERCPRWRALKLYIFEWARQHPDLDAISPLAWGVRERRGSWGI